MGSYQQGSWPQWTYGAEQVHDQYPAYNQYTNYSSYLADSMDAYQAHHHHLVHHHQMSRTTESKPRLSKEEVEVLEAEFQKNHKPNSSTKKALAESMRVDNARINNWFQNRRAREKKERNIREYEARQKLEKEKSLGDGRPSLQPERSMDLVASSAPFPNSHNASQTSPGQDSEVASSYLSDDNTAPGRLPAEYMRSSASHGFGHGYLARKDCTSPVTDASDANDADFALSTDEEDPSIFMRQTQHAAQRSGDSDDLTDASCTQVSGDDADSLGSSLDIAARRNRRPPPLSIGCPRSYSVGVPKSAMEASKRADSMRRVASATGPMRVTKSMPVPRSPFQPSRSPVSSAPRGRHAPPTPDTPVLANQPSTSPVSALDTAGAVSVAELAIRDPTLRTPPTTPGGVQSYFSLDSVYDMPISGQSLVNPSMSNFQSDYEPNKLAMGVSSYMSHPTTRMNHSQIPSFVSPMPHSSFGGGLTANNTEYNWPGAMGSRTSASPAEQQRPSQFLNMPAPSFGMLDR